MGIGIFGTGTSITASITLDTLNHSETATQKNTFKKVLDNKLENATQISNREKIAKFKQIFAPAQPPNINKKYLTTMIDAFNMKKEIWLSGTEEEHRVMVCEDHIKEQIGNTMYIRPLDVPKEELKERDLFILEYTPPPPEAVIVHKDGSRTINKKDWLKLIQPTIKEGLASSNPKHSTIDKNIGIAQLLKELLEEKVLLMKNNQIEQCQLMLPCC